MRLSSLASLVTTFALVVAPAAFATVNHGDFIGTGVDFLQVSETTSTAGDPEPIWDAPSLGVTGTQLFFFPTDFVSSCASGSSDTTASTLTTTIEAQAGNHIEIIRLQEAGDNSMTAFPPFGTPATNVSASLSGTVTVTETTSGPIAPVVIPFVGTFVPSANFALPTNFGGSTWTGDIDVDVLSQVPLATKADVTITNTLASNCAAGATSAFIQKKSVSGPSVALLINPLECDVELDKTCCVTQPTLPDFGKCEGDMVSMTLEYTGGKCGRSNNDQGKSFKCHGRRSCGGDATITPLDWYGNVMASPSSGVEHGDLVTFTSSTGTLPDRTKFKVRGGSHRKQYVKIDTSCDKAFECGDDFGAFEVVGFESTEGGVVDCTVEPEPGDPVCELGGDPVGTPCDAKVVDMVLEYNGQACQVPLGNPQGGEAECDGDATGAVNVGISYVGQFGYKHQISPASLINDGDRVRVTSTHRGGLFPNQKYLITDSNGVVQSLEFHTSCSQPLALGDEFGSLKVVEFTTKAGTQVSLGSGAPPADACEVPLAPPGPHCTGDLTELTLVYIGDYLGEGCTVSNPQFGYASCTGVDDPGDPVAVSLTNAALVADPEDQIEFGDTVAITRGDEGVLPWSGVTLDATGSGGAQSVTIKTSCHKPLSLGDRFGAWVVFGMNRAEDGPISLGGNIQYQYKVTNPNDDPIENVEVSDDQLGIIVSGETIAAGEFETYIKNATLFGTTTNVATATADISGDICDPGVDQVTVGVTAPPPGSFSCSDPINELSMTWDGTQNVLVKVWSGAPNTSTLIGTWEDVAPGDTILATGLGGEGMDSHWQIFETNGITYIGYSKFDLWCKDKSMNGIEDCGKRQGNAGSDNPLLNFVNDWILEGMSDADETLSCTPGLVAAPPDCGFGPELLLILPGLMVMHRRRMRRA